jgi:hypothetical protein
MAVGIIFQEAVLHMVAGEGMRQMVLSRESCDRSQRMKSNQAKQILNALLYIALVTQIMPVTRFYRKQSIIIARRGSIQ